MNSDLSRGKFNKKSVCFVALNAYGALANNNTKHAGGIEQQQSMMARWLVKRGWDVSMITWDEGFVDGDLVAGVHVYKTCNRRDGIRGLRFFFPRWSGLIRAMKKADADLYYYNCGDLGLGQIVLWAHPNNKKVIYSVASNPDCDPALPTLKPLRERLLYRFGLRRADDVIVQTNEQYRMLESGFGIKSTVLPMPSMGVQDTDLNKSNDSENTGFRVLWVGRISIEKRLEWLLEVAIRCPSITFDVVGAANTNTEYADKLLSQAKGIGNIKMHGRVVHKEMGKFYRQSSVLCCTSVFEGFPNTFLEAWSAGLPLVTTFDPDGVTKDNCLGIVADNLENIVTGLDYLSENQEEREKISCNVKEYFLRHHSTANAMGRFEDRMALLASTITS